MISWNLHHQCKRRQKFDAEHSDGISFFRGYVIDPQLNNCTITPTLHLMRVLTFYLNTYSAVSFLLLVKAWAETFLNLFRDRSLETKLS